MIELAKRLHGYDADGAELYYVEMAGLSGESKPTTGIISGSTFVEVDTGKKYVFDGISDTAAWSEQVVATSEVST